MDAPGSVKWAQWPRLFCWEKQDYKTCQSFDILRIEIDVGANMQYRRQTILEKVVVDFVLR